MTWDELLHLSCRFLTHNRKVYTLSWLEEWSGLGLVQALEQCLAHSKWSIRGRWVLVLPFMEEKAEALHTLLRSTRGKELKEMLKEPSCGLVPVPRTPPSPFSQLGPGEANLSCRLKPLDL